MGAIVRGTRNLKVLHRILAAVAVIAILFGICMAVSFTNISSGRKSTNAEQTTTNAYTMVDQSYIDWLQGGTGLQAALSEAQAGVPAKTWGLAVPFSQQGYASSESHLKTLLAAIGTTNPPASKLVQNLLSGVQHSDGEASQAFKLLQSGQSRAAALFTLANQGKDIDVYNGFGALEKGLGSFATQQRTTVVSRENRDETLLIVFMILAVVLAAAAIWWLVRTITHPLRKIGETLRAMRGGDLSVRADVGWKDEFGEVADLLNDAIASQAETQESLSARAREDAESAELTRAVAEVIASIQAAATPDEMVDSARTSLQRAFGLTDATVLRPQDADTREVVVAGRSIELPLTVEGRVVGVIVGTAPSDFSAEDRQLENMRQLAAALSSTLERLTTRVREQAAEAELRTKVEQILSVVNAAADGDLTVDVPVSGSDPVGQIGSSLARFLSDLRSQIRQIGDNSRTLLGAADQLTATASQMSAGAEQTSAQANAVTLSSANVSESIQTVAAAAEELTASIGDISNNATEAARVAALAAQVAASTTEIVGKLGDSSTEVGNVVSVITTIAQQTNLLALNATIEAASAGEAGKGFAVVASEVKELARETATATEDITAKIGAIQADTEAAVQAIEQISQTIAQITEIQSAIATAVDQQTSTTNEIARSVSGAAREAAEISRNIGGVADAAQSTSAGTVETQESAGLLAGMASGLQDLVGRFRL